MGDQRHAKAMTDAPRMRECEKEREKWKEIGCIDTSTSKYAILSTRKR